MENMTTQGDLAEIAISLPINSVVIYSVMCVLGVLGNGVVIWATGFRMKKTVSTVWYLNLAVADFLVTALLVLKITEGALGNDYGSITCTLDTMVFHMNMYASIYTLVVISVDRCVCVVWPVWTRNHRTVRKASWVSLGVWVMALALTLPYFIFRKITGFCGDFPLHSLVVTNFVMGFVVPFSVIVSCYSVIIHRLRNNRSLAGQSGRSFKIIASIIAAFFLCWLPYHIVRLIIVCLTMGETENSATLERVLAFGFPITFTFTLALLNNCLNPLLYVFSQGFKDVFRSRSILKVLEKAFAEEPPQTNKTPTDPAVTSPMTTLTEIEGSTRSPRPEPLTENRLEPKTQAPNREPPGAQDPSP